MAENGKDNTNLYLAIGVGGLAFYLWQKQTAAEQAALAAQGAGPLGTGQPTAGPQQLTPQPVDPVLAATRAGLDAILPGAGALAPLAAELGQNVIDEGEAMLDGIIHGGLDWETAGRVAELATAPFSVPLVASYNFVADLFGWSGKPLDAVNEVLVQAQINPPTRDTFQDGALSNPPRDNPIYAMDTGGVLHRVQPLPGCTADLLWCADFSWREIIAVEPAVLATFQVGGDITHATQIQVMPRPLDPAELRRAFGRGAIFKLGNDNVTVHGPWELGLVYTQSSPAGWVTQEELNRRVQASAGVRKQRF